MGFADMPIAVLFFARGRQLMIHSAATKHCSSKNLTGIYKNSPKVAFAPPCNGSLPLRSRSAKGTPARSWTSNCSLMLPSGTRDESFCRSDELNKIQRPTNPKCLPIVVQCHWYVFLCQSFSLGICQAPKSIASKWRLKHFLYLEAEFKP